MAIDSAVYYFKSSFAAYILWSLSDPASINPYYTMLENKSQISSINYIYSSHFALFNIISGLKVLAIIALNDIPNPRSNPFIGSGELRDLSIVGRAQLLRTVSKEE